MFIPTTPEELGSHMTGAGGHVPHHDTDTDPSGGDTESSDGDGSSEGTEEGAP